MPAKRLSPGSIGVLGLGSWATALAQQLGSKGINVIMWGRDADSAHQITQSHRNPRYLSDVALSPNVTATTDLKEALDPQTIVAALPSQSLESVLKQFPPLEKRLIISGIKGLTGERDLTALQAIAEQVGTKNDLCVLSGPGFAKDIVAKRPAGLVAASERESVAKQVAELFRSDMLRVYLSTDPIGVELGGTVKNVIAIAAGISDGLNLGDSARAGLITRGLAEMMRLAEAMGGHATTLAGLSGLGDLVLTSTCDSSRNRTVGLRIGRGESLSTIVATLGSVAEGVSNAPLVCKLGKRHGIELPITHQVVEVLEGRLKPEEALIRLISRPTIHEFGS